MIESQAADTRARQIAEAEILERARRASLQEAMQEVAAGEDRRRYEQATAVQRGNEPWVPVPSRPGSYYGRAGVVRTVSGGMVGEREPADETERAKNQALYWSLRREQADAELQRVKEEVEAGARNFNLHFVLAQVERFVPRDGRDRLPDPGPDGSGYVRAVRRRRDDFAAEQAEAEGRLVKLGGKPIPRAAKQVGLLAD